MKITLKHPISFNYSSTMTATLSESCVLPAGYEVEVAGPLVTLRGFDGNPIEPRRWVVPLVINGTPGLCLYLDRYVRETFPGITVPEEQGKPQPTDPGFSRGLERGEEV